MPNAFWKKKEPATISRVLKECNKIVNSMCGQAEESVRKALKKKYQSIRDIRFYHSELKSRLSNSTDEDINLLTNEDINLLIERRKEYAELLVSETKNPFTFSYTGHGTKFGLWQMGTHLWAPGTTMVNVREEPVNAMNQPYPTLTKNLKKALNLTNKYIVKFSHDILTTFQNNRNPTFDETKKATLAMLDIYISGSSSTFREEGLHQERLNVAKECRKQIETLNSPPENIKTIMKRLEAAIQMNNHKSVRYNKPPNKGALHKALENHIEVLRQKNPGLQQQRRPIR